jgi:predicted XRE-type DNA-binding protein
VGSSKRRSVALNGISVEEGSGSVYADLGYAGSAATLIKARLIIEIAEIIRNRGLTQGQAAAILGLTQPKVSSLLKGRFRSISERRLLDCLTRLGSSPTIHNPRSTIQSYARIA